jgi:FemAB-related protein (PEP-CTERM system-associated)
MQADEMTWTGLLSPATRHRLLASRNLATPATASGAGPVEIGITVTSCGSAHHSAAPSWHPLLARHGHAAMYCDPGMVEALSRGLGQTAYVIEARAGNECVGVLPLVFLKGFLFGRFLVSLPYTSWAGAVADGEEISHRLIDRAIELTNEVDADFLELRHLHLNRHPGLVAGVTDKVLMRLALARDPGDNWQLLKSEVRTQIRKAMKNDLNLYWGGPELLDDFYAVFAHNMRDLGTPVYPKGLFRSMLDLSPGRAELGLVRMHGTPIAACLAVHGPGLTEIPSAAALRAYRGTAANSLLYWRAIERAIERGQAVFDFGRSTPGSPTFIFKRKWGAEPLRAVWQYHLRRGDTQAMRPENRKFQLAIRLWRRLPVPVTRILGPMIARGIP